MTRGARMVRSSSVRIGAFLLSVGISFFMMPYLIRTLGDRAYGLWALVGSFLGYYGLMDIGLSSAVGRFLSRAVGQGDPSELRKVTSTSFYLFLTLGLLTALITVVLAVALKGVVKDPADLALFRFLLLVLGFNFAVDFPVRSFNAVFSANIRDDIGVGISIAKTILNSLFIVLAMEMGYGLVGLALVTVGFSLVDSLTRIVMSYRVEPLMTIHPRWIDRAKIKPLFNYSAYTFVGKIADILRFRVDNLVISAFVSLGAVTHFYVAVRLVEYISEFVTESVRVIGPVFSQDEGRNDYDSIRKNFLLMTRLSVYLAVFLGGLTLLYGGLFILRWMGPGFESSVQVLGVLLAPMILVLMQGPSTPLLYGISKHKYFAYANVLEGMANLFLSLWLVKKYGVLGVALGTAIPMAFMAVCVQPWFVCRAIALPAGVYARALGTALAISVAGLAAGWLMFHAWAQASYGHLAAVVTLHTLVYWPWVAFVSFTAQERSAMWNLARRALFSLSAPQIEPQGGRA